MNVLLIDDDEDTTFLMGVMLKKSEVVDDFHIETKASDALRFLANTSTMPDCIFVDLKMPEMNGFEFIEKFEVLFGDSAPHTHLYILSSSARQSDQLQARGYKSVKDFILKPLTKKELYEINEKILDKNPN